jgi:hypothetical protein
VRRASDISLDALAYSANCGLLLEIRDAKSLLMEQFWAKALDYAALLAIIGAVQVWLLVRQMESTTTPSVR